MDRLGVIIADMIKSALSWEEGHGIPQHENRKIEPQKRLTVIRAIDKLYVSENVVKEENNDHQD